MSETDFDPEEPFSKREFGGTARSDPPTVVVRFTRELEVYEDGEKFEQERLRRWPALKALWDEVHQRFGNVRLRPLFRTLPRGSLEDLIARAKCRSERYRPAPFFAYFQVVGDRKVDFAGLAKLLREHPDIVANADVERVGPPPAVNLVNEPAAAQAQFYLNARPVHAPLPGAPLRWALGGINAKAAWLANGGDGTGVNIIDIERGWFRQHVDFPAVALLAGQSVRSSANHGAAVLGILCAQDRGDNRGGVGIAPHAASIRCVSYVEAVDPLTCEPTVTNLAGAIAFAASQLVAGDVLLIESTLYEREIDAEPPQPLPAGAERMLPVEAHAANWAAIAAATAAGITVVEPGGNGTDLKNGVGLGEPAVNLDEWCDPGADCGAIMVSAACVSSGGAPYRFGWAPHGARVDCYAHGQGVFTTTCVPPPALQQDCGTDNYVPRYAPPAFGGTSAAAAIVAGAVAVIQGLARAKFGVPLAPAQVRTMVGDTAVNPVTGVTVNTPVLNSARTQVDGVMPDLAGIMQRYLGL